MQPNHSDVVSSPPALSSDEALALLEQAEQELDLLEELGYDAANSYRSRRAWQRAKYDLAHAQVSATLAVADQLRELRGLLAYEFAGEVDPPEMTTLAGGKVAELFGEEPVR